MPLGRETDPEQDLRETRFCDFRHPAIQGLAGEIGEEEPRKAAVDAFLLARERIIFGLDLWQVRASETARKGYGMCSNKALLFVALLRSKGIPARLAYVPMRREALRPVWGRLEALMPRVMNHVIAEVHLEGEWIPVDLTLDERTYRRLFVPAGVEWAIDWDGAGPRLLFTEHVTGPVISFTDVDEALLRNAGNRTPPRLLASGLMNLVNRRIWPRVRGAHPGL